MSAPNTRIGFIGSGNMAWNLCHSLQLGGYSIEQVISRTRENVLQFAHRFEIPQAGTQYADLIPDLDLVIIATHDGAIEKVARELAPFRGPETAFVHCSGSVDVAVLKPLGLRTGVLYPMQTLNKQSLADFSDIPIFIEGQEQALPLIREVAEVLSRRVLPLDSAGRRQLHLGAVFACNFPNFLWVLTEKLVEKLPGVDFDVYEHLVRATVENVFRLGPENAQTGPARRHDSSTLKMHEAALDQMDPGLRKLYQDLSNRIQQHFSQEG